MAPKPKTPRPDLGFQDDSLLNADPATQARVLTEMRRSGAPGLRINAIWGQLRQGGQYDFSKLDALVNQARAHGIKPQLTLLGTPKYMAAADQQLSYRNMDPRLMKQFATDVAQHFKGRVHRYSPWNEPNQRSFIGGDPKKAAVRFRRVYQAGYGAIKNVDPSAQVLFGELASGDTQASPHAQIQALNFMRKVLAAGNRPLLTDGMALHPYLQTNPNAAPTVANYAGINNLDAVQQALKQAWQRKQLATTKGGRAPLYITEFGYRHTDVPNEHIRAQRLARAYQLGQEAGARQFVQYQYLPTASNGTGWQWDTSVADRSGRLRPELRRVYEQMRKGRPR